MTENTKPTWQEQVREWHSASLTAIQAVEALDKAISLQPESPMYEHTCALIDGYIKALDTAFADYSLADWLGYWAWECDFGRNASLTPDTCRAQLADGSRWPLDSIDNFIAMLEREAQITEEQA